MIVITGAHGFIGSRVLRALLLDHGPETLLAVDHPVCDSKAANRIASVQNDNHDEFLLKLCNGALRPSLIIHMGACSSTTESNWDYLRSNNLEYSQKLWTWCAENNARFIYASSAATYGDGSGGFDDEADIRKLEPLNLYGRSKQEFDLWVADQECAGRRHPPQCVGFKFFNVFGPGESHKGRMASMTFHACHQIKESGRVRLFKSGHSGYEDGGQLRDFIYVDQVVDVIMQCVRNSRINGLFNLGTGKARSFRDMVLAVFAALGLRPSIDFIPMPPDLEGKYQYFTEATMAKASRAGLRVPELSLEDAVATYVKWLESRRVAPSGQ